MTTSVAAWFRACGLARSDARGIARHVLGVSDAWLIAHDDEIVPSAQISALNALAERRKAGEPLAYLVGEKEFYGRIFRCTSATLTPRPETELLVDIVLALFADEAQRPIRVLDVGTGSGCIGITLACERPAWQVTIADVSTDALAIARANAEKSAPKVRVVPSDWFSAFAGESTETFDLIVSNPPYVAHDDPHLTGDGLRFEPRIALTDGADGLSVYRYFAAHAHHFLESGGWLAVEHGFDQAAHTTTLFSGAPWTQVQTHVDLAEQPRVMTAQKLG